MRAERRQPQRRHDALVEARGTRFGKVDIDLRIGSDRPGHLDVHRGLDRRDGPSEVLGPAGRADERLRAGGRIQHGRDDPAEGVGLQRLVRAAMDLDRVHHGPRATEHGLEVPVEVVRVEPSSEGEDRDALAGPRGTGRGAVMCGDLARGPERSRIDERRVPPANGRSVESEDGRHGFVEGLRQLGFALVPVVHAPSTLEVVELHVEGPPHIARGALEDDVVARVRDLDHLEPVRLGKGKHRPDVSLRGPVEPLVLLVGQNRALVGQQCADGLAKAHEVVVIGQPFRPEDQRDPNPVLIGNGSPRDGVLVMVRGAAGQGPMRSVLHEIILSIPPAVRRRRWPSVSMPPRPPAGWRRAGSPSGRRPD